MSEITNNTEERADHKEVEVFINDRPYHFKSRDVTGREIKEKAHVPDNYSLYLRREGSNEPIADTEKVELHDGQHFFTRPPSNVS